MIPYFQLPTLEFWRFQISIFGLLSAIGLVVGYGMALRECRRRGLDPEVYRQAATPMLLGGMVVAHLVHLLLYYPATLVESPWKILELWNGVASTGAVVGALAAFGWVTRRRGVSFLRYADAGTPGLAAGWGIGRIGCFLVHDHPGVLTEFPLAVAFPDGARHDLGLYEALALGGLFLLARAGTRLSLPPGAVFAGFAVFYGAMRFGLDFLRAYDARYFGLTPAQFGAVALSAWGALHLTRAFAGARAQAEQARAAARR